MNKTEAVERLKADLDYRRRKLDGDRADAAKTTGRSRAKQAALAHKVNEEQADVDMLTLALAALERETPKEEPLTIDSIGAAMKGNAWWLEPESSDARTITRALSADYLRRSSHTQIEWTEAGLAKARAELPKKMVSLPDEVVSETLRTLGDIMRHAEPEGCREAAEQMHAELLSASEKS
jgi:hypothetical protein